MISPELLNGGLLTSRDPGLLDPGQLVLAQNGFHKFGDPTLWRIPGHELWSHPASAASAGNRGLVATRFDSGAQYILAQQNSALWYASAAVATGATMTSATTLASSGSLDGVQFGNRFYLYNGVDTPLTFLPNLTTRVMGLLPVTESLNALTTATGTFSNVAGGYYDYWITEVYKSTATAEMANAAGPFYLESAFAGTVQTINVPASLAAKVAITLPLSQVNPLATHWRVYRGGPKVSQTETIFPIGFQIIDEVEITEASKGSVVYDGSATTTGLKVATTLATSGSQMRATAGTPIVGAVTANDGDYLYPSGNASGSAFMDLYGFNFGTLADPIGGIEVTVISSNDTTSGTRPLLEVQLSIDGGTTWSAKKYAWNGLLSTATATKVFGSASDKWGYSGLTQTNMATGNFRVRLMHNRGSGSPPYHKINYVAVNVHYNGAVAPDNLYNAVVINADDQEGATSGAGTPPVMSVASQFEGMLVSNNVAKPNQLRYSQAGNPEYWPSLYYLNIDTDDNDAITFLGSVNNRLIVGQGGAVIRVNYLPTENDSDARRGIAWEVITRAHGVLSPKSACVFTGPDGRQLMAFVSHNGVYATDGYTVTNLSENMQFYNLITSTTQVKALVADPETHTLWLYLNNKAYIYHYLTQVWTGPCYVSPSGSAIADAICVRADINRPVHYMALDGTGTAAARGKIYVSDTSNHAYNALVGGYSVLGTPDTLKITTRDMHLAGRGNESRVNALSVLGFESWPSAGGVGHPLTVSASATMHFANAAAVADQALEAFTALGRETVLPIGNVHCNAVSFTVEAQESTTGPANLHMLLVDHTPSEAASIA